MNAMRVKAHDSEANCHLAMASQQKALTILRKANSWGIWAGKKKVPKDPRGTSEQGKNVIDWLSAEKHGASSPRPSASSGAADPVQSPARPLPLRTATAEPPVPSPRGRPVGRGHKGTFAGRRPSGCPVVWKTKVDNYWQTRNEIAANYPGKAMKLPSLAQEKYWAFTREFMKANCEKGCSKAKMKKGLADASRAYKDKLIIEAEAVLKQAREAEF